MDKVIGSFRGEYSFLSNFFHAPFYLNEKGWQTVEHCYQAAKAANPEDSEFIRSASFAAGAKHRGRGIKQRADFEEIKLGVMKEALIAKFSTHLGLKQKLETTRGFLLQENNYWHDNYWGNCTCNRCSNIEGENHLGRMLMEIRE
jgi:ribA/ribD-fused uncharacterized protein